VYEKLIRDRYHQLFLSLCGLFGIFKSLIMMLKLELRQWNILFR